MPRDTQLKKVLFACDELSGFVHACGLVRPTGLDGLEPKSVKKKLKQPSFAAGVHRDEVYEGAKLSGSSSTSTSRTWFQRCSRSRRSSGSAVRRAALVAALLVVALAGCGGADDDGEPRRRPPLRVRALDRHGGRARDARVRRGRVPRRRGGEHRRGGGRHDRGGRERPRTTTTSATRTRSRSRSRSRPTSM